MARAFKNASSNLIPEAHPAHTYQRSSRSWSAKLASRIAAVFGSMAFVYACIIWFGVHIVINRGVVHGIPAFDPYPFNLLTMIVSLLAIFMSTFVLIAQNQQEERDRLQAATDHQILKELQSLQNQNNVWTEAIHKHLLAAGEAPESIITLQ